MTTKSDITDCLETVRDDDYVEYFIFLNNTKSYSTLSDLQTFLEELKNFCEVWSKDYIWQKDCFNLKLRNVKQLPPVVDNEDNLPPYFYGVTHYGENIEDEWFIVFLLLEITNNYPDLIVRVIDVDGEFLLIEAADHLPSWANPEICDKRVYLYRGHLHVIPPENSDDITNDEDDDYDDNCDRGIDEDPLTVSDAIAKVLKYPEETKASKKIQEAIVNRINGYPEKITDMLHHTNVYVPAAVAALLRIRPNLIAPAVIAFCNRDPIDIRVCKAMRYFPPERRVMSNIQMTRCLYAQLFHQKYTPDRRTGWQLPAITSPEYLSHSLGVKLACGFEILASQYNKDKDTDEINFAKDRTWLRYRKSLMEKGYFKDLLEGSKEYVKLENEAKNYYSSQFTISEPSISKIIHNLLEKLDIGLDILTEEEDNLPPPDDDSWMEVSSEDLDKMLRERYGTSAFLNPSEITKNLTNFMDHVSGLDGAEFPDHNQVPIRPKRGVKKNKTSSSVDTNDDENNRISFDPDSFTCAVQNILDFSVPEDKWDLDSEESGMSSYEDETEIDLSGRKRQRQKSTSSEISEMKQYMDQMDRELASTSIGQSFIKQQTKKGMEDSFSDIENFEPVDIDMNALKNIIQSYEAQMGGSGPALNLLGPMGSGSQQQQQNTDSGTNDNNNS